jgi:hypothetical protein
MYYICVCVWRERESKIPLIRLALDRTGAELYNIPVLSEGTCTELSSYVSLFVAASTLGLYN